MLKLAGYRLFTFNAITNKVNSYSLIGNTLISYAITEKDYLNIMKQFDVPVINLESQRIIAALYNLKVE